MHMVAARLGFEKTMVGTRWATPRPDCMDRLRKHYSVHMVAARLGFEKTMVGTRWATPRPDYMDRLRKHYSVHMVAARLGFEKTMVGKVTWGNFGNGVTSGILSSDDYNSSLLPAIQ